MMEGYKRQWWNGVVDMVFCALLITAAALSFKSDFMQLTETADGTAVYSGSISDSMENFDRMKDSEKHKVRTTVAGIALMFAFCGLTVIITLLAYVVPYQKIRLPLKWVPMFTILAGILSAVGGTLVFIQVAEDADDLKGAKIRPYIGFICCNIQAVLAMCFMCVRSFYKPIPATNFHQPQTQEMGQTPYSPMPPAGQPQPHHQAL